MARDVNSALLVIDVQNDFCPGGALAVPEGDAVVPVINRMQDAYQSIILTQDWHPAGHLSFASNHEGAVPFSTTGMPYGEQVLWPDHCIQGSNGAGFHGALATDRADLILRKGSNPAIDSYSAFFENDKKSRTGLEGYLREKGISRLMLVGLATDFCVAYSALDGAKLGFEVSVDLTACRGIDLDGSLDAALAEMKAQGVTLLE